MLEHALQFPLAQQGEVMVSVKVSFPVSVSGQQRPAPDVPQQLQGLVLGQPLPLP
jgi:hypothetical protein